jgi:hypothetical protein
MWLLTQLVHMTGDTSFASFDIMKLILSNAVLLAPRRRAQSASPMLLDSLLPVFPRRHCHLLFVLHPTAWYHLTRKPTIKE